MASTGHGEWVADVHLGPGQTFARRHKRAVTMAVVVASVATCAALAAIAGRHAIAAAVAHLSWWFLPVALVAHVVAYASYVVAHHHIANRSSSTSLDWGRGARLVVVGFGAWLVGGGFVIDRHALQSPESTSNDGGVSATVLGLLELALLAPAAWLCALLLLGSAGVPDSETVPWVVGVPLGTALAIGLAVTGSRPHTAETATSFARMQRSLVAGLVATFALLRHPGRGTLAAAAIAAYWAADIVALWAALRFLSESISMPRLILAYATGYILTRRTLPFAGAVIIEAMMAVSLVWVGVPLAVAVLAVLVYRLSDFTFTLGGALLASAALERTLAPTPLGPGTPTRRPASSLP